MTLLRKVASLVLAAAVTFAFVPVLGTTVNAASKKSVYTVTSTNIQFASPVYDRTSKGKVKYNKKGFVTSYTGATAKYKIKYNKNCTVKQVKLTPLKGTAALPSVKKFTWKKNKLSKTVEKSKEFTTTIKYTYKGKKIVKTVATNVMKTGKTTQTTYITSTYKYKKGHVSNVKSVFDKNVNLNDDYTFDAKGNIKTIKSTVDGANAGANKITLIYDSHNNPKLTTSIYTLKEKDKEFITVSNFKFKKKKVSSKYYKAIKEQQWKLLNCIDGNSDGVSFAW